MHDGNRGDDTKTGLRRWLLPAIIFAVAILALGGIQHWLHYEDAARNAASYARDAQNQIAAECGIARADKKCAREIEQARRANQRDEYDLYSQKAMALWTAIMGAMTVIGVALSGFGIYLIWRTWDATREAAESSRKTLRAFVAKERAFARVESAFFSFEEDKHPRPNGATLKIRNVGESACTVQEIAYKFVAERKWAPENPTRLCQQFLIPANSPEQSGHLGISKFPSDPCWLIGSVRYRTLDDGQFTSYFSFKVEFRADNGYGPEDWFFTSDRMVAMPYDA